MVHKLRNIANKLLQTAQEALMPKIRAVYYQTNREAAILCATQIVDELAETYPAAIKCFQDDLENCLNHIDFPAGHHKHIRSTNLIERAFVEQKRRTKVIPRLMDEKSCLKLVFATLIRAGDKWRRVSMSQYDLALLK
ncbi:transposase, partial [bacterium]|nr:transposase [bacterium]